jgi:hypothetical protein
MPVPKPNAGESQNDFISRCISFLEHEGERPHEQIQAICFAQWREGKQESASTEPTGLAQIVARLNRVRDFLIERFGEAGRAFYEHTLVALGVYDPKTSKFNAGLLKSDLRLPFLKFDKAENNFEIGNIILAENEFSKVDPNGLFVGGYANTLVCDCVGDIVLPESYKESVEKYDKPVFFMHHTDIPAGEITNKKVDDIGWYVESQPDEAFRKLVENKTLKGYSVGGFYRGIGQQVGNAIVWSYDVEVTDLSYVTNPCNKLSFFSLLNSQSSKMTVSHNVKVHEESKMKNDFSKEQNFPSQKQSETLGTGGYACRVGDEWKLPINDVAHARNAAARYNQAEGCQTPEVKARICAALKHFGVEDSFAEGGFCYNKGEKKMSEECKQNHTCPEGQEWNDTEGKCVLIQKTVKTIDTQIEDLLKERDERNKQELLGKMKSKVLEEEKAREEDRVGEVEKKIGGLEAKFNDMMGKLAVFLAKFDELGKRMTKMEETPDVKQASQLEEKKELSSADTFEGISPRDAQYWRKTNALIEKMAEEKQ